MGHDGVCQTLTLWAKRLTVPPEALWSVHLEYLKTVYGASMPLVVQVFPAKVCQSFAGLRMRTRTNITERIWSAHLQPQAHLKSYTHTLHFSWHCFILLVPTLGEYLMDCDRVGDDKMLGVSQRDNLPHAVVQGLFDILEALV